MATNHIVLGINFRKNTNARSAAFSKYYAVIDSRKTLTTDGLAAHIAAHNCPLGAESIKGVLIKLAECIPELLSQGQPIKLDGLGTFSVSIKNGPCPIGGGQVSTGGLTEEQLKNPKIQPSGLVHGVKINFRPDGTEMQNITSKNFLRTRCSLESRYIVTGTEAEQNVVKTPLETFRAPAEPEP